MATPAGSDDEFFDAFENQEESKNATTIENSQIIESSPISDSESKMFYSEPQRSQRAFTCTSQFSTDNSISTKKDRFMLCEWSSQNLTKKKNKDTFEFAGLEEVQRIQVTSNDLRTWVVKWSPDGRFLAVAGDSQEVKLYEVVRALGVMFREEPYLVCRGHSGPVVDFSWSKSSTYFLTAGTDNLVLLWSIDSSSPALEFKHPALVSCVCFHPRNANLFMTGGFDRIVRIWSIPQYKVECYYQTPDFITAGSFNLSGELVLLGLSRGQCVIYEVNPHQMKLTFITQLECKNRSGWKSKGRKITGIDFMDDHLFLVTTNDSRMRLYSIQDFSIKYKYKGNVNENNPIRGSFSHNKSHVICGSENGSVYIWNTYSQFAPKVNPRFTRKKQHKNNSYEYFPVTTLKASTIANFAPEKLLKEVQTRYLDSGSDIIIGHILTVAAEGQLLVFFNQYRNVKI